MSDERWAELVKGAEGGPVSQGSMFGSRGLRTGRRFFALWWHQQLIVKLPPDRRNELEASGLAEPFEPMSGRVMNGWVMVRADADWLALAAEARAFVEGQPAPSGGSPRACEG